MEKRILGLDLGTNSIGWALVKIDSETQNGNIIGLGSRIIPMAQDILDKFSGGEPISTPTALRTNYRSARRLRERHLLRRERILRVLNILGFLPEHYAASIDFERHFGKFIGYDEPKLPWRKTEGGFVEFIFQTSFDEMLDDFRKTQPRILYNKKGEPAKIPYDWTIYYLRKKALSQKIEKGELAWLLLNFNQKRGYYQLRGVDEEEDSRQTIEYKSLKIIDVVADKSLDNKGRTWYSLELENGWIYRYPSKISLSEWKGQTRDFIVTTDLDESGNVQTDKEGNEKRSLRMPKDDDWLLLKKKTEYDIDSSHKTVGAYIYDCLLQNPSQKIRGKLVHTIERKYYKEELRLILNKQKEFHSELRDEDLYSDCVRELYRNNEAHEFVLSKRDFTHLFVDDIIFYQRPLRSKKSTIDNCPFEYIRYVDKKKPALEVNRPLKVISKSNPYYQEFRLWQWLQNLAIYRREDDCNVTKYFLSTDEEYTALFDFLNQKDSIEQKQLIQYLLKSKGINGKDESKKYRWNFVEDKKYPCNTTRYEITKRLANVNDLPKEFLTSDVEQRLWHIIYSVTDKEEFEKALRSFANNHNKGNEFKLDVNSFVTAFRKIPPFKSEYGAYSEKAIKKLLPLMRIGRYWNWDAIGREVQERIDKILTGEYDANIPDKVREKLVGLTCREDFQGMPLWLAQYVVYGRHSEASAIEKWTSAESLDCWLKDFKQYSLRNPIVEQVITETMRVVGDIWKYYGNGAPKFFDEIHIELGRDIKHPADIRKKLSDAIQQNENTNTLIRNLLKELQAENGAIQPESRKHQELLKIYDEYVFRDNEGRDKEKIDDINRIRNAKEPTKAELTRYRLYLEQGYRSPYTGQIISLSELFTDKYQIEHVIPRSRYFDDSLSNKVICETAVNLLKGSCLGMEFIKKYQGQKVETGFGKTVTILSESGYKEFVQKHYAEIPTKRKKLLLEDIPEEMIERQLNDTRYISRFISTVLSNIVREENNDDGVNSKNIILGNGVITSRLKSDWGLADKWNDLMLPRFERMNKKSGNDLFTRWSEQHHKLLPTTDALPKKIELKRLDHRHHAMDALVIACMTREHVNLLNNLYAQRKHDKIRYDLKHKLMQFEKVSYFDEQKQEQLERYVPKYFLKPWGSFPTDAVEALSQIVVSFKQNTRILTKATNKFEKWVEEDGCKKKMFVAQKGDNWAIRKPLHKDTPSGKVDIKGVKVSKGIITIACRKELSSIFTTTKTNLTDKAIEEILKKRLTDKGIQKILKNYLKVKNNDPALAFSPEGIEELNRDITRYNGGKPHKPILRVRIYEKTDARFVLGTRGNKSSKYVEAAKGTNLFFAIYANEDGTRRFDTIPLNEIVERLKQKLSPVPEINARGESLLFYLSPNDLVYVPTKEERDNRIDLSTIDRNRIYKMVSCTKGQCFFVPHRIAYPIVSADNLKKSTSDSESASFHISELGVNNKSEKAWDEEIMIKQVCVKLKVDRLGNIKIV